MMDRNDVFLERRISLSKNVAVRKGAASFSRHQTAAEIKTPLAGDLSEHAAGAAEPKGAGLSTRSIHATAFLCGAPKAAQIYSARFFPTCYPTKIRW